MTAARADEPDSSQRRHRSRHTGTVDSARSFFLIYENDVFTSTDRYFTQGVRATLTHPVFGVLDAGGLLTPGRLGPRSYSLALRLEAYTPSSIRSDSILRGDRPYAALAYLSAIGHSYAPGKNWQASGALSVGVIGPAALGEEIQTVIHRATDNFLPLGWQHQIANDVVLNYALTVSRVPVMRSRFHFYPSATVEAGTLVNRMTLATTARFDPIGWRRRNGLRASLLTRLSGSVVGYDARLQGGVFNRSTPYVLRGYEIERFTARASVSMGLRLSRVSLTVGTSWLTREFKRGAPHRWGALSVGYDL